MQEREFNKLMLGHPAKAAIMDRFKKPKLKHLAKDKSEKGKQKARLFIEENEQPFPADFPVRVANLVKKLRKKNWSEEKIRNHIKRHHKITVI